MLELKFRRNTCVPLSSGTLNSKPSLIQYHPTTEASSPLSSSHTMLSSSTRQLTVHWTHHAVAPGCGLNSLLSPRIPLPPASFSACPWLTSSLWHSSSPFHRETSLQDTLPQMVLNKHRLSFTLGHLHFLWKVLKSKYFYIVSHFEAPFNKPWLKEVFHQY